MEALYKFFCLLRGQLTCQPPALKKWDQESTGSPERYIAIKHCSVLLKDTFPAKHFTVLVKNISITIQIDILIWAKFSLL